MTEKELIFLVVLDDSKEIFNALRYAARRTARTNGRVALLYTFETLEFSHWKAVEDIAEIELREEAESKIKEYENYVLTFSSKKPKKFIMKGDRLECIIEFLVPINLFQILFWQLQPIDQVETFDKCFYP